MNYTSSTAFEPEIILVIGDFWIPDKAADVPKKFYELLRPGRITKIICTGNLQNEETYDWLRTITTELIVTKGEGDKFPKVVDEFKTISFGGIKIGVISGTSLSSFKNEDIFNYNDELKDCILVVYGRTHYSTFEYDKKERKLLLNPGSCTGAPDKEGNPTTPTFWLICPAVNDEEVPKVTLLNCYKYELNDDELKVSKQIAFTEHFKQDGK